MPSPRSSRTRLERLAAAVLGALLLPVVTAPAAGAEAPGRDGRPDRGREDAYVALGDSFSAGNGTEVADLDPACRRSSLAYAPLVTADRPGTSLTFVACSGATTTSLVESQVPVLDRRTDFVTLTVGGNDIGFGTLVATCVGGTEEQCLGLVAATQVAVRTELPARLDTAYRAVADRVRRAEVVVLGYPRFFAEDHVGCAQSQGISATEAAALNTLAETLDEVVAERAHAAGFTYVSVLDAFTGHDMCAPDPWVNGVVAATPADAYHPTVAGYADGYAPLVAEQLQQRRPSVSQGRPARQAPTG